MKSTQRVFRLAFFLALVAALLLACVAPAATTDSAPADDAMAAESAESEGPIMGGVVTGFVSSDPKNFDPAAIAGWDQGVIAPNLLEASSTSPTLATTGSAESFERSPRSIDLQLRTAQVPQRLIHCRRL